MVDVHASTGAATGNNIAAGLIRSHSSNNIQDETTTIRKRMCAGAKAPPMRNSASCKVVSDPEAQAPLAGGQHDMAFIKATSEMAAVLAIKGIRILADWGGTVIVLIKQFGDFAQELADDQVVVERGKVTARGLVKAMQAAGVCQLGAT